MITDKVRVKFVLIDQRIHMQEHEHAGNVNNSELNKIKTESCQTKAEPHGLVTERENISITLLF